MNLATSWITVAPKGSRTAASFVIAATISAPLLRAQAEITLQSAVTALARMAGALRESDISRTAQAMSGGRATN
jgi:hypothetical protein